MSDCANVRTSGCQLSCTPSTVAERTLSPPRPAECGVKASASPQMPPAEPCQDMCSSLVVCSRAAPAFARHRTQTSGTPDLLTGGKRARISPGTPSLCPPSGGGVPRADRHFGCASACRGCTSHKVPFKIRETVFTSAMLRPPHPLSVFLRVPLQMTSSPNTNAPQHLGQSPMRPCRRAVPQQEAAQIPGARLSVHCGAPGHIQGHTALHTALAQGVARNAAGPALPSSSPVEENPAGRSWGSPFPVPIGTPSRRWGSGTQQEWPTVTCIAAGLGSHRPKWQAVTCTAARAAGATSKGLALTLKLATDSPLVTGGARSEGAPSSGRRNGRHKGPSPPPPPPPVWA